MYKTIWQETYFKLLLSHFTKALSTWEFYTLNAVFMLQHYNFPKTIFYVTNNHRHILLIGSKYLRKSDYKICASHFFVCYQ